MHNSRIKDHNHTNKNKSNQNKNKSPESVFKGSSDLGGIQRTDELSPACQGVSICQNHTFQSSRSLLTENFLLHLTSGGRLRQHQAQPMWDASSQSQTTLPWSWRFKEFLQGRKASQSSLACRVGQHRTKRRRKGTVSRLVSLCREGNWALKSLGYFLGRRMGGLTIQGKRGRNSFPVIFYNLGHCDCSVLFHFIQIAFLNALILSSSQNCD